MLFNSLAYGIFLPCVFILYWVLPHKVRWPLMLAASYYFYMSWNAAYVALIAATTVVSWGSALLMEKAASQRRKKGCVAAALLISLGILYVFKYYNFSLDLLEALGLPKIPRIGVLLPVGISFYTFQTLSYVLDVYRGKVKAERNLGVYATFVSFFPQLVAGPIERSANLLPQITSRKKFDTASAAYGVRLILWGLYKKMVIADNLAVFVDRVYGSVQSYSGFSLLAVMLFFPFQIYCDFSGYSDIARGSAKLLGIDLMENFRSPYLSSGIREFWSRWHISLSTWFRDYVYIPLGGSRCSKFRAALNTLVTFLVSGLWHGASVTFVIWGAIHGVGQVCENAVTGKKKEKRKVRKVLGVPLVFAFVTVAWVFFRAATLGDAVYVLGNFLKGLDPAHPGGYFTNGMSAVYLNWGLLRQIALRYLLPLTLWDAFALKTDVCAWIGKRRAVVRWLFVAAAVLGIMMYGYVGESTFVYFQF